MSAKKQKWEQNKYKRAIKELTKQLEIESQKWTQKKMSKSKEKKEPSKMQNERKDKWKIMINKMRYEKKKSPNKM